MKAEVYPSPDGWRFRVKGNNGEIVCTGEAYVRRIDAEHVLRDLRSQPWEVVVRSHAKEVVDHYTLGTSRRVGDTTDPSGLTEEEKKLHYAKPYDPETDYDVLREEPDE